MDKSTAIRLPRDLHDRAKAEAWSRRWTMNRLIKTALAEYLDEERDAIQRAAAVEHDAFDALARKTRRLEAEVAVLKAGLRDVLNQSWFMNSAAYKAAHDHARALLGAVPATEGEGTAALRVLNDLGFLGGVPADG